MDFAQQRVCDIRLNTGDSEQDAELYNFLLENNILHSFNPGLIASHEQLSFMVALRADQIYVPCSDKLFFELMRPDFSPVVRSEYGRAWCKAMRLLDSFSMNKDQRRLLRSYCRKRMRKVLLFHDLLPSRLIKRLTSVILNSGLNVSSAWAARKEELIAKQRALLDWPEMRRLLDEMPVSVTTESLAGTRRAMASTEFARLACLAANTKAWCGQRPSPGQIRQAFASAEAAMAPVWEKLTGKHRGHCTILLLCGARGGVLFDLMLAHFFIERGHKVVYAVKDDFYFYAPTMSDMFEIPYIHEMVQMAHLCQDRALSKNELLHRLREYRLIIMGDGTRERLNLLRVSVSFARAWKEADIVLAHGWRMRETLLGTSHEFTRDILCWDTDSDGSNFEVTLKPHAASVTKFSETDLQGHADKIIARMLRAHQEGRPVIFYSCIIGSIPGQTGTALRLATAIVQDIQQRMPNAFIINPAGYFVEGMDGDDLMYMWERVQRSGYINIWYFQTTEDIERGFELLGEPMPEIWTGKDATYSTGCTKEMHIAMEVQQCNREMQILGPDPAFFFRRGEYGVGKYFDATLVQR